MTVDDIDTVDPWSPGYITPASTPSPCGSWSRGSPGSAGLGDDGRDAVVMFPMGAGARAGADVAVSVRHGHHTYANNGLSRLLTGKTPAHPVLNDFNMTVRQGSM